MLKSFVTGAIGGALAMWWFKDAITETMDARTRTIRRATASRLHALADTIERGFEGPARDDTRAHMVRAS